MSTSKREFYPIHNSINVQIILPEVNFGAIQSISLYCNQTLNEQFKLYLLKNNIILKKEYFFYLKKGKDILKILPKKKNSKEFRPSPQ